MNQKNEENVGTWTDACPKCGNNVLILDDPYANIICSKCGQVLNPKCPECGNYILIIDWSRGESLCSECGLVLIEKMIDQGPEWRAFTSDEINKKVRVGAPTTFTMYDKGLSTLIGWKNKDAFGKLISPKKKAEIRRLRKWNTRTLTHDSKNRNLSQAMSKLDVISSHLGLSKELKESIAILYRKTMKFARGRSIETLLLAAIYVACKIKSTPKSIDELLEFASNPTTNKKKINKCYNLILTELKLNVNISSPKAFVSKYCAKLNLSGKIISRAVGILNIAEKLRVTVGKTPSGLAGAAIYIAGFLEGERRTQREISVASGVTEATIRNRYKELIKITEINAKV